MDVINYLASFNWQTIVGMFAVCWYFTHDLKVAMEKQNARTDKLYEMFCETQKEIAAISKEMREERKELDQKFYDLLKHGKK